MPVSDKSVQITNVIRTCVDNRKDTNKLLTTINSSCKLLLLVSESTTINSLKNNIAGLLGVKHF